jgi:tryptophan-rich sensory protein
MVALTHTFTHRHAADGTVADAAPDTAPQDWRAHLSPSTVALGVIAVVTAIAGAVALHYVDTGSASWFHTLDTSRLRPSHELLGRDWMAMYALMALAAWLVWRSPLRFERARALAVFGVQLVLSAAWGPVLFHAHAPEAAMLVVAALWLAVLGALTTFAPANPWSAVLLLPWFAWVTYAAAMNAAIVLLN